VAERDYFRSVNHILMLVKILAVESF
jgi:hypothetical protein